MSDISNYFYSINEPYAAGAFEEPDESYMRRYCRAERRFWENCAAAKYNGGKLYPCGKKSEGPFNIFPSYTYTYNSYYANLPEKAKEYWSALPFPFVKAPIHMVGGSGYTHSIPNYSRVAKEGLNSYQERVNNAKDRDFRISMTDVIEGVRAYHRNVLAYLKKINADEQLIEALEQVPFEPARNLYEAIVCRNFVFYLDGCDNIGRIDAELIEWYNGEDVTDLLHAMFENIDDNNAWTGALGPDYNPLTYQCLNAVNGMRRPTLELRITDTVPDELWTLAEETIKSGGGQPSFYNEKLYQEALCNKFPDKSADDLKCFCGGGCTESMLAGMSNVGSLDAGVNLAYIFRKYMEEKLPLCTDFDSFFNGFTDAASDVIKNVLDMVSDYQRERSLCRSQPMRTLLIDDCIDNESDFVNKGARHYWSVINVAGLVNVIDSMLAVREAVYEKKLYSRSEFVELLDNGGKVHSDSVYGRGDEASDRLAADLTERVFSVFDSRKPYLGGAFLPSSIQFETYIAAGKNVGATPDGRGDGDELCDSLAAIHGNDREGCLAMLKSVTALPLYKALGTPVVNLKLNKAHVDGHLRDIVKGYFRSGGMQLQVTCQSREDMIEAMEYPEKHPKLIVRIGGYSEYFNRLSNEMKQTVIDRTEF